MQKPQVLMMYARIPSADFQWMALGAGQYLATDRTALEISGRVEIANHIKPPRSSRNGQLSVSSSSSNSSSLTPTLSGTLCTKATRNFFINSSAKLCCDIVRVPLLRSLEYRHPPYHFKSPRFLTGMVRFKSTHNLSHLSFCHTAKTTSTCTTAMIAARPSSIKRKTYTSVMHCSKPSLLRHVAR